VHSSLTARSAH